MTIKDFLILLASLVVGGLILYFWGGRNPQVFGSVSGTDEPHLDYVRYATASVAMLVGIFLGGAFRVLQAMKEAGETEVASYTDLARRSLRSIDFAISLVAAPLVYVLLIKTTDGVGIWGLAVVALQNGFFCNAIIQKLVASNKA